MSWLEFVNKFFFQFFFIRLTRCTTKKVTGVTIISADLMMESQISIGANVSECEDQRFYSIQGFIVPFTGWSTPFRYIIKHFNYKLKWTIQK